ncbi:MULTISPECIES: hypothetical protein [unclassified Paraburkholderia]|jgi:hypothetical protein|uniref:hypothetical protein n=1 Tax=unclassified Paraburkholderia TaxID=2615204 RepID=UPI0038BAC2A0
MVFRCFDLLGEQYLPVLPDDADKFVKVLARAVEKVDLDNIDARQQFGQTRGDLRNIIQCEPEARSPQVAAMSAGGPVSMLLVRLLRGSTGAQQCTEQAHRTLGAERRSKPVAQRRKTERWSDPAEW